MRVLRIKFCRDEQKQYVWHTMRWKITDPQFVAMWGYHFTLESDGNQYNKYYIQSVTVTKLTEPAPPVK